MGLIAYADGPDSPRSPPHEVAKLAGLGSWEVLLGWTLERHDWLASPALAGRTVFAGYALADAVAQGRLAYIPVRFSALPRLLFGPLRPDVAVVTGVRRGGRLSFAGTTGWGPAAARAARIGVVVELAPPEEFMNGPDIPGRILAAVERPEGSAPPPALRPPNEVERAIGLNVASVIPDGATVQIGPGGIAGAILAALQKPVSIWSGLVTDSVAALDERGLLTGPAVAAYSWGGEALRRMARRGRLRMLPVEETHDISRLSAMERFTACNTALQVALDGSVNVERSGMLLVAGIGGHADFCAGAARARGGISIVALRSTNRAGDSTLVRVADVVSTPRCDVDVVVTEHGTADLRNLSDRDRRRRLVSVASPEHCASLLRGSRAG